ncbi:hypothetical protein [Prosthecobacter sp.]|uniref:hypothetical protein n=1 Tax=Prosthecobacter sp. TaxID=1965333 RepID=UPI003783D981
MKTAAPATKRKANTSSKFTTPVPEMAYEAWLEESRKFHQIMEGKTVDCRPASVIVRESR